MASPFTMYFAGMGTVVAALAVGFSTAVMMTSPLPSEKEQPSAFEKRNEAKTEKPAEPARAPEPARSAESAPELPVSPLITAIQTPTFSTVTAPAAPEPPSPPVTTGVSEPKLAPDPGMRQVPVRPGPPVEAAAPAPAQPATASREVVRNPEPVPGEWKKKEKRDYAKKQRKPIEQARPAPEVEEDDPVVETRAATGYAPEPRPAPLGIFNLLMGN